MVEEAEPAARSAQAIEIFESNGDPWEDSTPHYNELSNDNIHTEPATHNAALEIFAGPVTRQNERTEEAVHRIRKEIENLRISDASAPCRELLQELSGALRPKPVENAKAGQMPGVSPTCSAAAAFSELHADQFVDFEDRVAKLEAKVGRSVHNGASEVSVSSRLESIQQVLDLLAKHPQDLRANAERITQNVGPLISEADTQPLQQIEWLYKRLLRYEGEIALIPQLVSRLQTLRVVHSKTASQVALLAEIETSLQQLSSELAAWRSTLETLETQFRHFSKAGLDDDRT